MIDQWEPTDIREFRTSRAVSPATAVRQMAMLKPFFEWCLTNEWIVRNPARLVKDPKGRDVKREEQKLPFTDEELKRMYDACHKYGKTSNYKWTGEDLGSDPKGRAKVESAATGSSLSKMVWRCFAGPSSPTMGRPPGLST
jgi:integrase